MDRPVTPVVSSGEAELFVLVESNTTGTGRDFAEAARRHGLRPVLLASSPARYPYAAELGLETRAVDTGCAEPFVVRGDDGVARLQVRAELRAQL